MTFAIEFWMFELRISHLLALTRKLRTNKKIDGLEQYPNANNHKELTRLRQH